MHSKERHTLVYPVGVFEPSDWLRFIHLGLFESEWLEHRLDDEALRALEVVIMAGPDRNPIMKGTNGLRKIRFSEPSSNRGKSGSYRIGYVYFPKFETVLLATVWGKNEKSNLNDADKNAISLVITQIRGLLERGKT